MNSKKTQDQSTEVITREELAVSAVAPASNDINPMQMIALAVQQGADVDKLEKLMALQERWEANEAKKAYVVAMAQFSADAPELYKDKKVSFLNNDNSVTSYNHATLAQISGKIGASLAKYGMSHSWKTSQANGQVEVTCKITHKLGHVEEVTLMAAPDSSGKKNGIQQIASTVTYLERYTLLASVGLAAHEQDDDGRGADVSEYVTEADVETIIELCAKAGMNTNKLCEAYKVETLERLPLNKLANVTSRINATINKKAKGE